MSGGEVKTVPYLSMYSTWEGGDNPNLKYVPEEIIEAEEVSGKRYCRIGK